MRRDVRRREREAEAAREAARVDPNRPGEGPGGWAGYPGGAGLAGWEGLADDELGLIFLCCHPSLDPAVRVALTLRSVCGLAITQGHMATGDQDLVRGGLCDQAVRLARALAALMPREPETAGLLALLLLTDARRGARSRDTGDIILLEDQDRGRWDRAKIAEGEALLEQALRAGRPGPYQLQAAIAACHSCAPSAADTDWREIAALYGQLIRYEPTPVVEANRAVAVAMAEGPAAGLAILDALGAHPQMGRWPQFHIARAELLRRVGRFAEAADAYRAALRLEPPAPEQEFIGRRITELGGSQTSQR